jgi:DNA-directed RNA polymerase subunit RPC12/RpoP
MQTHSPTRTKRLLLATVVAAVAVAVFCSARLDAQGFRPPRGGLPNPPQPPNLGNPGNPRMPNMPPPPTLETVWKCMSCGAELGRGGAMPRLEKCPHCGVRFINGTNPFPVEPPPGNNPAQPPTQPPMNPPLVQPPAVSSLFVNTSAPNNSASSGPPVSPFLIAIAFGIFIVAALGIVGFVVLVMWIVKSANRPAPRRPLY